MGYDGVFILGDLLKKRVDLLSLSSVKIVSFQAFSLNFAANVIASLQMLRGSVRALDWVKPTLGQFVFFASLALGANVLFAWLGAEAGSVFNSQGLVSYLIWPTLSLLAGIILARHSGHYSWVFVPVILWLSADAIMALVQSLMQMLGFLGWLPSWAYAFLPWVFMGLFIWQTLALLWVFAQKMRWSWLERVLILFGVMALLTVWQINVQAQPIFKAEGVEPILEEQAFYTQPILLQSTLDGIDLGRMGQSEWYFMGVAGFGGQDVFRTEIMQLHQLFDVRFRTSGRSLALINNQHTWLDEPIASKTSILMGLKRIGQQMNPDEDVLFLALSSHGGQDVLELSNPPLALENLEAAWLRQALDEAGIRWRVIVVSACYSGSFIDELQSPTTVVITASRSDRASFGCSNDADLTYFGRAFFSEALRENKGFIPAFNDAKKRIAERESNMGFESSEPQMVIGDLMKTALPAFEKILFEQNQPFARE